MGEIMHIAVRSSVAAGVALVGAGAVALSPVQPVTSPLANVHVPAISASAVNLTAGFDPITPWVDVITAAAANVTAIGQDWLANPAPALRQLGTNTFGYAETFVTALGGVAEGAFNYLTVTVPETLRTALQQVANGQVADASRTLNDGIILSALLELGLPFFPVTAIPGQIANNAAAVVNTITDVGTLFGLAAGVLAPIMAVNAAFGDTVQAALDAAAAGDPVGALNATLAIAPNMLGALLNGNEADGLPGFLTPDFGGLVYTLAVGLPQSIAEALGASAPGAARIAARTVGARTAAAVEPAAVESGSEATGSEVSADAPATDSTPAVKDGNKVEPGETSASAAGARNASSGKKAGSKSSAGAGKSSSAGKGHSAR